MGGDVILNERPFNILLATMQTHKPTKREKATAQRKAAILEAAVLCFIESGYHQTGMRDIAKRAGVSLGNLYNYFGGKTDILADIAAIERNELVPYLEILAKDAPAIDVLSEFVPAYTRHLSAPETIVLALEITGESIRHPDIASLFTQSRQTLIEAIAGLLERGIREASMRDMQCTTETSYLILEIMEGTAFRHGIEHAPLQRLLKNQMDFIRAAVRAGD